MTATLIERSLFAAVGVLLEYPRAGYFAHVAATHDAMVESCPDAALGLSEFLDAVDGKDLSELEDLYARTFDFAPLCNAYVSVHLFGDESFKRSQLMSGLVEAYQRAGFDPGAELPDHLAVILRFAPQLSGAEWDDMVTCCLRSAVTKMIEPLERAANPYHHALRALLRMLDADYPQEANHV
ncbi:MAG: molecular chaperone TorD family protein [Candidatus Hydrogenedentes bacterium]|nr:molecular chaperone TorD family protein [Candidatus Hydrogenedentota bacterium]